MMMMMMMLVVVMMMMILICLQLSIPHDDPHHIQRSNAISLPGTAFPC